MYVPSDYSMINGQGKNSRRLERFDWVKDILEIKLINADNSYSQRNLGFNWNVTNFEEEIMNIKCYFQEAVYVSSERQADTL